MAIRKHNPYPRLLKAALILTFIIGLAHSLIGCSSPDDDQDTIVKAAGYTYYTTFMDIQHIGDTCIRFPSIRSHTNITVCGTYTIVPVIR